MAIEAGDRIDIRVYKAPDLSLSVPVPESGEINYPVLGSVRAAGADTETLARRIAAELERIGHLQNPEVTVSVSEMAVRKVFILGAVKNPSQVTFSRGRPMFLTQAIAVVGGFTSGADRRDVRIMRRRPGGPVMVLRADVDAVLEGGNVVLDVELAEGDTVYVAETEAVYVYGQVNSQGAYRLPPGVPATVSRIVSLAGGTTRFARTNRTRLIRRSGDENSRMEVVDLKAVIENGQIEKDAAVRPGDIIFVPETLF